MGTQSAEVAVVGAGPYGLSVAAHLARRGVETLAFGEPMDSWRHHMPKGMYLKSTFAASSLSAPGPGSSFADYCKEAGVPALQGDEPVPLELFTRYGLWFQKRYVAGLQPVAVRRITRSARGFGVSLSNGETVEARAAVIACGQLCFAYVPPVLRRLMDGAAAHEAVSHVSQHADMARFAGRSVCVVGAGQSALESAVLLHEAGADVHLLVRRDAIRWGRPPVESAVPLRRLAKPTSPLGPGWSLFAVSRAPTLFARLPAATRLALVRSVLGPSGAWWLHPRFDNGIGVTLGSVVEEARLTDGKVALRVSDGARCSVLEVDHVMAATGYRVDLDRVGFLDADLRAGLGRIQGSAAPRLSGSFEASLPGLHFTGLAAAPTFGPLMRFVCGTDFAARRISAALAGSRRAQAAQGA
ncbi:MAG: NAD(P)/FAD-dependent oxidoreductase [Rhodospirillaceae bacterium]|nr:NAD(P)/FAD-dependent oxidoreductase [Rhodospirillaceae bacterium]